MFKACYEFLKSCTVTSSGNSFFICAEVPKQMSVTPALSVLGFKTLDLMNFIHLKEDGMAHRFYNLSNSLQTLNVDIHLPKKKKSYQCEAKFSAI